MRNIAVEAGFKLRRGSASNQEIIAITGHKSEQSLVDYDPLDEKDHKLGKILSSCNKSDLAIQRSCSSADTCVQLPPSTRSTPGPSFVFNNCAVYFGSSHSQHHHQTNSCMPSVRKRQCRIDSDSEKLNHLFKIMLLYSCAFYCH